jgi:hypothetical protein
MCESTEREHRKGALSGKTLLEFVVFVRVTCDVTEKIRKKKYRFSNKESESFVLRVVVAKKKEKKCLVSVPPRRKTFRHLEVKFWCFEEFFERRCSYR